MQYSIISATVIMLYIKSSNLIHLITESLYPLTNLLLFPTYPSPLASTVLFLHSAFLCFRFHIQVIPCSVCLTLSDFFISIMPSKSIHVVVHGRIFFSFFRTEKFSSCVCVCVSYFIYLVILPINI